MIHGMDDNGDTLNRPPAEAMGFSPWLNQPAAIIEDGYYMYKLYTYEDICKDTFCGYSSPLALIISGKPDMGYTTSSQFSWTDDPEFQVHSLQTHQEAAYFPTVNPPLM
jgi:hypothetical protein